MDSLIRKLPYQYQPIDYLAENIKLRRNNKKKYRPFSDRFAKAVEKLAKDSNLDFYSEEDVMPTLIHIDTLR